ENGHGHSGHNNRFLVRSKPYDKKRGQGGFWQAVQYYQVGVHNFRKPGPHPEKYRKKHTQKSYQKKTGQGFVKSYAQVQKDTFIQYHTPETACNLGRTAENKGIDDSGTGGKFPKKKKNK